MRRWKLSPMDMQSITRWEDYSRAKDTMMQFTDLSDSPWYTVESDDKKTSRINVIQHLLSTVPYEDLHPKTVEIPGRPVAVGYHRPPRESNRYVPDHAHTLPILVVEPKKGAVKAKAKNAQDKKAAEKRAAKKAKAAAAASAGPVEPTTAVLEAPAVVEAPATEVTQAPAEVAVESTES